MVIKGGSVAGAARLPSILQNTDSNERMEVLELRGVAAKDLRGALQEMEEAGGRLPELPQAALSCLDQHAGGRAFKRHPAHAGD